MSSNIPFQYIHIIADVKPDHLDPTSIQKIVSDIQNHYGVDNWIIAGSHLFDNTTTLVVFLVRLDHDAIQKNVTLAA